MAATGRPSKYTKELAANICQRLSEGESLRSICRDNGMPTLSTVMLWRAEDREGFSEQYDKARECQAENLFNELLEIADNEDGDTQRDRLRVDTRKWFLSKVAPKIYGDKVDLTSLGERINFTLVDDVANKYATNTSAEGDSAEQ